MNKKVQKLNRTAAAAVLAASGVVVAVPHSSALAEEAFKDLTPSNSHYSTVMELFERGIISGYPDGTFKPNAQVTRGQAAKMIASILNLNIKNVKNPQFKDVTSKHSYYPYIAALVDAGIINGYVDNTFRPTEVITRGQMAKMLVKGFQFAPAKTLNHTFTDVSDKNGYRYEIQTLVNLEITKGTSAVTFSPAAPVTRAQLASFLIRAENANVHNVPVKEVTKIERQNGTTYVYLNGVKHTINASLAPIFTENNTEAVTGAHIEGTIVGTDIRAINKLSFNAVGAANNILQFDGANSTYRGAVTITGNHLRFSNWNVTGEVKIVEPQAKSLSNIYKPLSVKTIASLKVASDNIDWGTITPPSELTPTENDGLVEIPTNNKPKLPTLKTVSHNVQFVNVTMRTLAIEANRTKITSNNTLANVRVGGYVREFELFADVTELYIESDDNVTFYGQSDINKLYKNSYKSLNLYADSITNLIAVDNKNGWIDLGDYFYADKVVVPPLSLPHEIFNDFLNDSDKIGDLEDPNGKDIDRDPIENTIVPDQEPPELQIKNAETDLNTVNVTVNSTEDGNVHYLIKKAEDGEPSIREIMQYTGKMGGFKAVSEGKDTVISVSDLEDETKYIIYAVAVDEAGNVSNKQKREFDIVDATAPVVQIESAIPLNNKNNVEVKFRMSEEGAAHYVIRKAEEPAPTVEDVKRYGETIVITDPSQTQSFRKMQLDPFTDYVVYMIGEDDMRNLSVEVVSQSFRTGETDLVRPYLINPNLDQDIDVQNWNGEEGDTKVTLRFNEPLDAETATNLNNYMLSGTGNLTGRPYKAELSRDGKNVVLTVPSMSAFVNNDTLVVTINGVMDQAGNEVEPNTQAVLRFLVERGDPKITITNVSEPKTIPNSQEESKDVTVNVNAPGRYYYLVLPNVEGLEKVDIEDVIFPDSYLDRMKDIVKYHVAIGTQAGGLINAPGENIIKDIKYNATDMKVHPNGYRIYMVMQNRDGKYSEVVDAPFISDILHPQIQKAGFVSSVESTATAIDPDVINTKLASPDTVQSFEYAVDPTTKESLGHTYLRYAIRFDEQMDAQSAQLASNYRIFGAANGKLRVAKATLLPDGRTVVLDLVSVGEVGYEQYALKDLDDLRIEIFAVDTSGLEVGGKYNTTDGKEILPDANGVAGDGNDVSFVYKDVVKPKLKNVKAIRVNETLVPSNTSSTTSNDTGYVGNTVHKIKLSFTEDVTVGADKLGKLIVKGYLANGNPTSAAAREINPSQYTITTEDSSIIVTITEGAGIDIKELDRITFNMVGSTVADVSAQANPITVADPQFIAATYIYREMPLKIEYANLPYNSSGQSSNGGTIFESNIIRVGTSSQYGGEGIVGYYATRPDTTMEMTPELIMEATKDVSDNYGSTNIEVLASTVEFVTDRPTEVFRTGQYIYYVLADDYGNVSNVVNTRIERNTVAPAPNQPNGF